LPPDLGTVGPPGRGVRGEPEGAFAADDPGPPPPVAAVVWVVLFTVLPPVVCVALWVERDAPVPAAPGCGPLGGLDAEPFGAVPAPPGREAPLLGAVSTEPGRGLPDFWDVPAAPGAVCPPAGLPEGGT